MYVPVDDWKYEFWGFLTEALTEKDDWYSCFKPVKSKAIGCKTDAPGIGLWFRVRQNYVQVTVTVENTGIDRIEFFWDQLKQYRDIIDSSLSIKPEWLPAGGRVSAARIATKVTHPGDDDGSWWGDVVEPLREIMDEYRKVILPLIDGLEDLETTHYYAIKITDEREELIVWKGGITNNILGRFNQHVKKFGKDTRSSSWRLELVETIAFEKESQARSFETRMLSSELRAPNIEGLSSELFKVNPIEYSEVSP